ncbi:hypothetical protein ABK040_010165 [Willaertia magna]
MSSSAGRLKSRGTSFIRSLKEIGTLAIASFDELKTSLVKATNHDPVPPKEKHVKKLLIASHPHPEINLDEFMKAVCRVFRKSNDWLPALKGLEVLHRIIQEGSTEFCESIIRNDPEKRFKMDKFKDRNTSEAMDQSPLVRQYCRYLEERMVLYRTFHIKSLYLDMSIEAYCSPSAVNEWIDLFECLQKTTVELLECFDIIKMKRSSILSNGASIGCLALLLDDSFVLYKILTDNAVRLLDDFYNISLSDAKRVVSLYEKYCRLIEHLEEFFEFGKTVPQIYLKSNFATLTYNPFNVVDSMKEYINSGGQKKKKLVLGDIPVTDLSTILTKNELEVIKSTGSNEDFNENISNTTPTNNNRRKSSSVTPKSNNSSLNRSGSVKRTSPPPFNNGNANNTNPSSTSTGQDLLSFDWDAKPKTNTGNNSGLNNSKNALDDLFDFSQPVQTTNPTSNVLNQFGPTATTNNISYNNTSYNNNAQWNNNVYGGNNYNPYGNPYENNPYSAPSNTMGYNNVPMNSNYGYQQPYGNQNYSSPNMNNNNYNNMGYNNYNNNVNTSPNMNNNYNKSPQLNNNANKTNGFADDFF